MGPTGTPLGIRTGAKWADKASAAVSPPVGFTGSCTAGIAYNRRSGVRDREPLAL